MITTATIIDVDIIINKCVLANYTCQYVLVCIVCLLDFTRGINQLTSSLAEGL